TAALFLLSCSQGHCRRQADAPPEAPPIGGAPAETKISDEDHVFVYKYDGSLQCGMGKAVSLETMGRELQGIPVVSSAKKNDGLMHIQVCGSITGKANVFEIPAKFLKGAEAKGFKRWTFE